MPFKILLGFLRIMNRALTCHARLQPKNTTSRKQSLARVWESKSLSLVIYEVKRTNTDSKTYVQQIPVGLHDHKPAAEPGFGRAVSWHHVCQVASPKTCNAGLM